MFLHALLFQAWAHVKGPRKKVNIQKWIFVDEMYNIIRQFDDFGCFFNVFFCNFVVFLAQNEKYPKITVLNKLKLIFFLLLFTNSFQISYIYHSYSINCKILLACFVICNVLGHFYHCSDFHVFPYFEKCVPLNAKPFSTFQYLN